MSAPAPTSGDRKADPLVVDPPSIQAANDGAGLPMQVTNEIARLAYSYWEARGCQGGSPEEDWLRAEEELRARK